MLIQLVVLTAAAGVAVVAIYDLVAIPLRSDADGTLYGQFSAIAGGLAMQDGKVVYTGGDLPTTTSDQAVAIDAVIYTRDGLLAQTSRQSVAPERSAALASAIFAGSAAGSIFDSTDPSGAPIRVYVDQTAVGSDPANQVPAVVLVSRSIASVNSTINRLLLTLYLGGLLVVAVGGALAYLVVGRVLSPVARIAEAARTISEQDLHRRIEIRVPDDELGELVATFNQMLDRLDGSFRSLRQFTADASHELRSPLTLMRTEVEVALTRAGTQADYERVLRSVRNEVEHLTRIADHLLLLARADAGSLFPVRAEIDVADFIEELAARWEPVAARRQIELSVEAPDSGTLQADPDLLKRVLDNLIDNALRYTPALASVHIGAWRLNSDWLLEVADMGPGIPPEMRERIFARFSRADTVRTRRGGGAGLGLALSLAVAEAHGGSLMLLDRPGAGAVFQVRLPGPPPTQPLPEVP